MTSCSHQEPDDQNTEVIVHKPNDVVLSRILSDRKLIATTDYNSTNYFVYRGEPMGYQYELLKSFADYLNVKLEIKIINDIDESFQCMEKYKCDIMALGLTVTKERSNWVDDCLIKLISVFRG